MKAGGYSTACSDSAPYAAALHGVSRGMHSYEDVRASY